MRAWDCEGFKSQALQIAPSESHRWRFDGQPSRGLPTVAHARVGKRERRLEAPPGFEPGWRFCRAIPGDFRAIVALLDHSENLTRSRRCVAHQFPFIVSDVGQSCGASDRGGHTPGTAQEQRVVVFATQGTPRVEMMLPRTSIAGPERVPPRRRRRTNPSRGWHNARSQPLPLTQRVPYCRVRSDFSRNARTSFPQMTRPSSRANSMCPGATPGVVDGR